MGKWGGNGNGRVMGGQGYGSMGVMEWDCEVEVLPSIYWKGLDEMGSGDWNGEIMVDTVMVVW